MKEKIKEIVDAGGKFLIACRHQADEAEFLAGQTVKKILEEQDKEVFFWPDLTSEFAEKYGEILPAPQPLRIPQKIKIKIPKEVLLDEMRYEEENEAFNIIISPKSRLEPSSLTIEKTPYEIDGLFYFGDNETFLEKINLPVVKPAKEKRIGFIREGSRLSGKLADFCGIWDKPSAEIATLIFSVLFLETEGMSEAKPDELTLAGQLVGLGADCEKIARAASKEKTINQAQLLGRALARTTIDAPLKTAWTFLKADDFEKTKMAPSKNAAISLLKRIRKDIQEQNLFAFCWQDEKIQTMFWSKNKSLLENMASRFGVQTESVYFFGPQFENFSEAEIKIRQLLRELLRDTINYAQ